jgi:hypothetical protein
MNLISNTKIPAPENMRAGKTSGRAKEPGSQSRSPVPARDYTTATFNRNNTSEFEKKSKPEI